MKYRIIEVRNSTLPNEDHFVVQRKTWLRWETLSEINIMRGRNPMKFLVIEDAYEYIRKLENKITKKIINSTCQSDSDCHGEYKCVGNKCKLIINK